MPASSSHAGPSQFDPPQVHPEFGYFAPTVRFRRKFALVLEGLAGGVLVGAIAMFFATMEREEKVHTMLASPMLVTPVSSAVPSASPKASAPAAIASLPAASSPVPAAPVASRPTALKPASSTPASATSTPPQTAAVRGFAPVRFVPELIALPAATPGVPPVISELRPTLTVGASASVPERAASAAEPTPAPLAAVPAPAPEIKAAVAKPKKKIVREPSERASGPARAGAAHRLRQPRAAAACVPASALRSRLLASRPLRLHSSQRDCAAALRSRYNGGEEAGE